MANHIVIEKTSIQWKNPTPGMPTRRIPEHYFGRTIHAIVDNESKVYRLQPEDIQLEATEEDMINVIKAKIEADKKETEELEEEDPL